MEIQKQMSTIDKSLTKQQRRQLRTQVHQLKPVVMLGQHGLTHAVGLEIERALRDHELIKIRVNNKDRQARTQVIEQICEQHQAELIHTIGHVIAIYRENTENSATESQE